MSLSEGIPQNINLLTPNELRWHSRSTRLRAGRPRYRGSITGRVKRFVFSSNHPDRFWSPLGLLFSGYWGSLSQGLNRSGCEADQSVATNAEVMNEWHYTTSPHTPSWCVQGPKPDDGNRLVSLYAGMVSFKLKI